MRAEKRLEIAIKKWDKFRSRMAFFGIGPDALMVDQDEEDHHTLGGNDTLPSNTTGKIETVAIDKDIDLKRYMCTRCTLETQSEERCDCSHTLLSAWYGRYLGIDKQECSVKSKPIQEIM